MRIGGISTPSDKRLLTYASSLIYNLFIKKKLKNMERKINEIEINGVKYIPKESVKSQVTNADGLKAVLVRSYAAGVHYGYLKSKVSELNGVNVVLVNTRRVWCWSGASSLSQMALEGVNDAPNCNFSVTLSENEIMNCVEIIPLTGTALESLNKVPIWKQ